jgi:hypothetical protein
LREGTHFASSRFSADSQQRTVAQRKVAAAPEGREERTASGQPVYTRDQIKQFYELHRGGKLTGRQWEQTERDIIAAANEGRVAGALEPAGR